MRVIFVIRTATTFHYFASIVRALCERGHKVDVLFDRMKRSREATREPMEEIKHDFPEGFSYDFTASRTGGSLRWIILARELSSYHKLLLTKEQADLWRRAQIKILPQKLQPLLAERSSLANLILGTKFIGWALHLVERFVPPDKTIIRSLKREKPDVVIAAPVNFTYSSADLEYLKAAKYLGIPTVVPVMSLDNLTVRGPLYVIPDRLLVWNANQAKEAMENHGIPRGNIRLIGATVFDGWFVKLAPSVSAEEFAGLAGISAQDPYILWLGSPKNIATDETWLISRVKDALEKSPDELMRKIQIVVRPHPTGYRQYENFYKDGVVIFPKEGERPSTADARQTFYDTIHYASAAVNINTSGIIDAIIAGKPAIAIMDEAYHQSQEETHHFRQLLQYNVFAQARSPEQCAEEVKKIMAGRDEHKKEREFFVKDFIRPQGLEISAGEMAAREVEKLVKR